MSEVTGFNPWVLVPEQAAKPTRESILIRVPEGRAVQLGMLAVDAGDDAIAFESTDPDTEELPVIVV